MCGANDRLWSRKIGFYQPAVLTQGALRMSFGQGEMRTQHRASCAVNRTWHQGRCPARLADQPAQFVDQSLKNDPEKMGGLHVFYRRHTCVSFLPKMFCGCHPLVWEQVQRSARAIPPCHRVVRNDQVINPNILPHVHFPNSQ